MSDQISRSSAAEPRSLAAEDRLAALFPGSSGAQDPRRRRIRRTSIIAAGVVVIVVIAVLARSAFASDDGGYQTATVTKRDVASVLTGVGTIEPVSQATVAFPGTGTVKTVDVDVGDSVSAGQQLASLDTESLEKALHDDQATLAQAELTLSKALNGESVSSGTGGANPQPQSATSGPESTGSTVMLTAATTGSTNPEIAAAQAAVLQAQQRVDHAIAAADTAIQSADSICAAAGVTSDGSSTDPTATPDPDAVAACKTALGQVEAAQGAVTAAQKELAAASSHLDGLLAQQASAPPAGTGPSSGGAPTGSSPSAQGSSPSSADLVKYQKQVDAAEADVAVAEQALAQATIVSPIAGQVVAVNMAVGEDITSGASSTQNIVVKGSGGYEATTSVSVDRISDVAVGQPATVLADGRSAPIEGKVVAISVAPDSTSSSSTTTYRVTVALDHSEDDLRNGGTATIAIVTKRATSALAAPTSAITANGTRRTVTVLDGSSTKQVQVGVGVVGDTWTEITSGLTEGQTVVLATVNKPLPDSATSSSSNSGSGGQGFPGGFPGGGGGGGFPGFPGGGQ